MLGFREILFFSFSPSAQKQEAGGEKRLTSTSTSQKHHLFAYNKFFFISFVTVSLFFTLSFYKAKRKLGKEKTFFKGVSEQL